ncbi:MAG: hypothetical protein ACJASQ_002398 [Crocinitomicaceae bacterium]|jgi:hypothetical protein
MLIDEKTIFDAINTCLTDKKLCLNDLYASTIFSKN